MLNILTEPVIRMDTAAGRREASLPGVYAALMADKVNAFPALRPHQRHAWHAFLVQLGAMAMHRAGISEPPLDAAEWAGLIRGMTPDWPADEPWQLVVDDITKPAFMQPRAHTLDEGKNYSTSVTEPDGLDILVTAKNHDLKSALVADAGNDDWTFALITVQTMDGDPGRNPGISRMNGSFGNRPAFSITFSVSLGAHAKRDIMALLELRSEVLANYPVYKPIGGEALLWVPAWNGTPSDALALSDLDPYYIEVCRRWRLLAANDVITKAQKGKVITRGHRVAAQDLNGITGDPWAPIDLRDKNGDKVLTVAKGGFTYKRIVDYFNSSKFRLPVLAQLTPAQQGLPGTMYLVARATVRGQGKTDGYYERVVPVRRGARSAMLRRDSADCDFGTVAQSRIEDIGKVQSILRDAVATFIALGESLQTMSRNEQRRFRDEATPWSDKLDEIVDVRFFEDLQDEIEIPSAERAKRDEVRNKWRRNGVDGVIDHASAILKTAAASLPCPETRRYKARVQAYNVFEGRLRGNNGLPTAFPDYDKETDECPNSSQPQPEPNPSETQLTLFP